MAISFVITHGDGEITEKVWLLFKVNIDSDFIYLQEPVPLRQRRFSRQSSVGSRTSVDDVMIPLRGDGSVSGRKRTPSGKSVVSRTISLAEYHEDLKPSLKTVRFKISHGAPKYTFYLSLYTTQKQLNIKR